MVILRYYYIYCAAAFSSFHLWGICRFLAHCGKFMAINISKDEDLPHANAQIIILSSTVCTWVTWHGARFFCLRKQVESKDKLWATNKFQSELEFWETLDLSRDHSMSRILWPSTLKTAIADSQHSLIYTVWTHVHFCCGKFVWPCSSKLHDNP